MGLDAEQGGNLLMAHAVKHRQAEHAAIALRQGVDQAQNLVVTDSGRDGGSRRQWALQVVERDDGGLALPMLPGAPQIVDHPRHPGLSLGGVVHRVNLTEYQHERVVQQVVGRGLVGHVVAAHPAQPVVHHGVEQSERLLVAPLAPLDDLLDTQFAHRNDYLTTVFRPPIIYIPDLSPSRPAVPTRWPLRV